MNNKPDIFHPFGERHGERHAARDPAAADTKDPPSVSYMEPPPDDGCQLFDKYNPDVLADDPNGPTVLPARRGPVRGECPSQTPKPPKPPKTPRRIRGDVAKLVCAVLFALSQCNGVSASSPKSDEVEKCRGDAKAAAARMCGNMEGCTGGTLQGLEKEFSKGCEKPPAPVPAPADAN